MGEIKPLRLALTKGRLEKQCRRLLSESGYNCSALDNPGRRLIHALPHLSKQLSPLEGILAKAPDVITYIEHGVCDIGVAGKDTIIEQGGSFYEMLDLKLGVCRFALATPGGQDFFGGMDTKCVATKYPNVARRFLGSNPARIIKIEGSVELAPLLGLADAIIDIVETGDTLRANGLVPIQDIHTISARVIVNVAAWKLRRNEIESFLDEVKKAVG
ncbi:MAG: ATP phosphoribosyltransferase [Oscillospiraceae bacterium]|nr:ATP phosphoribosyltransferase [Oscillospiraceae bacterium]